MRLIRLLPLLGLLSLALFAAPAAAQKGTPVIGIDKAGASRNLSVIDPTNGAYIDLGALDTSTHVWTPAFPSQSANRVFSSPNGSSGVPAFRALAGTDIAAALGATANSPGWLWTQQQFFGQGNPSSNKLKTYAYGDALAPGVFLNPTQGAGVTGAGWTSLNTAGSNISIGVIGFGFADGTGAEAANAAWGIYGECRSYVGSTGYCHAQELDATNLRASTIITRPYSALAAGFTGGLHIAAGGGCAAGTPCYDPANTLTDLVARQASHALLIGTNVANFDTGIIFQCGSIGTTDCAGAGSGEAIRLYSGLNIKWYAPSDVSTFSIGQNASTTLVGSLGWSNSGLTLQGGLGGILHQFFAGASDVNGIQLLSSLTTASPSVNAIGSDTNIDLTVGGKGTGQVIAKNHMAFSGTAPAVSSCGTSPTIAGHDAAGRITVGTSPSTTCIITFAQAWVTNAPSCFAQDETTALTTRVSSASTSAVTFTFSGTLTAADKISYHCVGL